MAKKSRMRIRSFDRTQNFNYPKENPKDPPPPPTFCQVCEEVVQRKAHFCPWCGMTTCEDCLSEHTVDCPDRCYPGEDP